MAGLQPSFVRDTSSGQFTLSATKLCARCGVNPRASNCYCHACNRARYDWATKGRNNRYRTQYGITLEEYEILLTQQDGKCAICRMAAGRKRLSVDHDHKTGAIRGLLCFPCNSALGRFKDDPNLLDAAKRYLGKEGLS